MVNKHMCPVCGKYEFEMEGDYDICEVCGWENDSYQEAFPYETGANHISLMKACKLWKKTGDKKRMEVYL